MLKRKSPENIQLPTARYTKKKTKKKKTVSDIFMKCRFWRL